MATIGSSDVQTAALGTLGRFIISGGVGFLLYLAGAMLLSSYTGLGEGWVALLATLMAIPPTFLMQRNFTFQSRNAAGGQLVRYVALQAVSALVISGTAQAGARLGLPPTVLYVLAGLCGVGVSYLVQALLIFKD
jgi:putative flippase GtrA